MAQRLSHTIRERLDALLHVGEDDPFSALNRIKSAPSSPSTAGMRRLLTRLELIEETDVPGIDASWVNGNYQRVLFHTVRTASAARLRRMAAPRRHLALVCFLHQAWRDTLDQAVDMYGKLLERSRKLVERRLDEKLKTQRHAVDRIVQRYRDIGAVLLDPGVAIRSFARGCWQSCRRTNSSRIRRTSRAGREATVERASRRRPNDTTP